MENSGKFPARELPVLQIREFFMSRKFPVLQYLANIGRVTCHDGLLLLIRLSVHPIAGIHTGCDIVWRCPLSMSIKFVFRFAFFVLRVA